MRFLLACGGSGGHINPALSVARLLRDDGHEVLFVGAPQGLERDLVPREGFPIEFVAVRSLSHSLRPKAMLRNVGTLFQMAGALRAAARIVRDFAPDAALGMGGYASYPPIRAAARLRVPVFVHESNALPGVTTRALAKRADKILVGMEACRDAYAQKERVEVVGTPVRGEFFTAGRPASREALRLDNRPLIVSFFGSQGARDMNAMMLEFMLLEQKNGHPWQHIHVTGPKAWDSITAQAKERGLQTAGGLRIEPYIYNMPETMAAADLIICRAGASTLAELTASRAPSLLIPSPNVANDHQTANAKAFSAAGAAVMKPESGLSTPILYDCVKDLLQSPGKLDRIREALGKQTAPNAAARIKTLLIEAAM